MVSENVQLLAAFCVQHLDCGVGTSREHVHAGLPVDSDALLCDQPPSVTTLLACALSHSGFIDVRARGVCKQYDSIHRVGS